MLNPHLAMFMPSMRGNVLVEFNEKTYKNANYTLLFKVEGRNSSIRL